MRRTDSKTSPVVLAAFLVAMLATTGGCRTTADPKRATANLWSLETSEALRQACKFDYHGEDQAAVAASIKSMGRCIEDINTATRWHRLVENRVRQNWPRDFMAGGEKNAACLERLTNGLVVRYGEDMTAHCRAYPDITQARQLISDSVSEMQSPDCSDLTRMNPDGCFVREVCPANATNTNAGKRAPSTLCLPGVQRIHKVKDPANTNMAWNNPFVIELTGNQSSARITYGMPNCHGTAQAAAGDFLSNLRLEKVEFARTSDEAACGKPAREFLAANIDKPIAEIDMQPGGILINMKHEDCQATECGTVKLWVDECHAGKPDAKRPFDSGVFIDGMCVDCWGKLLGDHGLRENKDAPDSPTPGQVDPQFNSKGYPQVYPGCVLTTSDHSVFMVHRSAGWCFTYEATSPYGPPQLRSSPCVWLEQKFKRQYCP
jgi:hypothetical protein